MEAMVRIDPAEAPSFGELRERHLALLREWSQQSDPTKLPIDRAQQLRAAAQGVGGWLDDAEDRDRIQAIIDYWTAAITGAGDRSLPELVRLAEFNPALPQVLVGRGEAIIATHAGTAVEDDLEAMLMCLVRPGPRDTVACRLPVERGDMLPATLAPETAQKLGDMLDAFVEARIVRRIPGDTPDRDRFELMYGSVARAWPRLHDALKEKRSANETRDKLRATAQLWMEQKRDPGYLLGGSSLNEAGKYLGENELLNQFIRASRRAANRRRNWLVAAFLLGPAAAVLIAIGFNKYGDYQFGVGSSEADFNQLEQIELKQDAGSAPAGPSDPRWADAAGAEGAGRIGVLWAGRAQAPMLTAPGTGETVDPATIADGGAYRTTRSIYLRSGAPDENYVSRPVVGVAPAGSLVVAQAAPVPFERASGRQYWIEVRVVPRVYIHAYNESPRQLEPLKRALRSAGFEVPPLPPDRRAIGRRALHIFDDKGDDELAAAVANKVARTVTRGDGRPPELGCVYMARTEREAGTLDLWLDLRGLRVAPERQVVEPAFSCAPA